MLTRRQFLAGLIPGLALLSGGTALATYRRSTCPLSAEGYCVGPCSALLDGDGDLICDRVAALDPIAPHIAESDRPSQPDAVALPALAVESAEPAPTREIQSTQPSSASLEPPTPTPAAIQSAEAARPTATATQQAQPTRPEPTADMRAEMIVLCPFGLVNDRYPGRCRRYVDRNGNGICDLSEPRPAEQSR
ncbi:MAG: hypothetical protein JXA74_00665 [Anaerolineae bacterium]|nr:hypothetical protein [Anaerolineae bacterium]